MLRLSKFTASVIVGSLTALVLGGVWTTVLSTLPTQQAESVTVPDISPPRPSPPPSDPEPPVPSQLLGEASVQSGEPPSSEAIMPPVVKQPLPVEESPPERHLPIPLTLQMKCDSEAAVLCPADSERERRRCIQEKWKQFPPRCREFVRERIVQMRENVRQIRMACKADVRQFCPQVSPLSGDALQCLEEHAQEVSEPCFQTLPKRGRLLN